MRIRILFHFDVDPYPTLHFDVDPYPTLHFDADLDPFSRESDADHWSLHLHQSILRLFLTPPFRASTAHEF